MWEVEDLVLHLVGARHKRRIKNEEKAKSSLLLGWQS